MRLPATTLLLLSLWLTAVATAGGPPECVYANEATPSEADDAWRMALVDTRFRLPVDFIPPDLVPVRDAGLDDDRLLRSEAVADLGGLLAAAASEGHFFELQSAYRSFEYQRTVFDGWVAALGRERALATSARPGHSEHQLGTALDLRSAGGPAPWELEDWAQTPEGAWLQQNGWRFGFVMSYPAGAGEVTCYDYEPWHYRWFGRQTAERIHSSGLTAREWLWRELHVGDD